MNLQIDNSSLWIKINKLHQNLGITEQDLRSEFNTEYEPDEDDWYAGYDYGFYKGEMQILDMIRSHLEKVISEEANELTNR